MRFRYRVGIRGFESSQEWPLPTASTSEVCTIRVEWAEAAETIGGGVDGLFVKVRDGYEVRYARRHSFRLRSEVGEVFVVASEGTTIRESAQYLVDAVWPGILSLRGTTVLHAASASIGDHGVLIVGASGSGKSTLALTLSRVGCDLLGDEWAPLTDDLKVEPSNAAIRLQREWAGMLGVSDGIEAGEKTRLEVSADQWAAKPVAAVVLLETGSGSVALESVPAAQAFSRLMESCFRPDPDRFELLDAQIEIVTRLVNHVPIVNLRYPHGIESMGQAVDCLQRLLEQR